MNRRFESYEWTGNRQSAQRLGDAFFHLGLVHPSKPAFHYHSFRTSPEPSLLIVIGLFHHRP